MKHVYDPKQVRPAFRAKYCKEYVLPSGKMSGYYRFDISDEEINDYADTISDFEPPKSIGKELWATTSEWLLWSALRNKYGINYLNPMTAQLKWVLFSNDVRQPDKNDKVLNKLDELENRIEQYVDHAIEFFDSKHVEIFHQLPKNIEETKACMEKDFKKFLKEPLDSTEI